MAKTTPLFDALVKVAPSSPAIATVWATPGVASSRSETAFIAESVRARAAPGGSCTAVRK